MRCLTLQLQLDSGQLELLQDLMPGPEQGPGPGPGPEPEPGLGLGLGLVLELIQ